jgi:SAM-dependent methyltransferase
MSVDFGKTSRDYARHRAGFPEAFFDRLVPFGIGQKGQRLLDLGTGTGTVARGFARRGCVATGIDRSAALMEEARRFDAASGVSIRYVTGVAEDTGFPTAHFDVVTAGQCWHWFDRARAAKEARRVLKQGGALVIAHFDWLPIAGNVVDLTEKLIEAHNPNWKLGGTTGIHPEEVTDVALAGFGDIETFSFDVAVPYTHEGWRGRVRASAGVGASLPPDAVARFNAELAKVLADRYREDPIPVPHRVWAVVSRAP